MAIDDIRNIIKQIRKHCNYIYLHVLGEPLLHPDFNEILEILDQEEMKLQLVTNGTLLGSYPNLLKHSCLRKISISLHSIRDLEIERNYFETINRLIEDNGNSILELRFYDYDHLSADLKGYYEELRGKYGLKPTGMKNCFFLKENTYILYNEFFDWPMINDPPIGDKGYCLGGKEMIAILNNGDVTLCCLDPKGHNSIGNIFKTSLDEILNEKRYLDYLASINKRRLIFDLCTRCSYRLRFGGNNN